MEKSIYKELENSLKLLYGYDAYVAERKYKRDDWHASKFGPQTKSESEVTQFIEFAKPSE